MLGYMTQEGEMNLCSHVLKKYILVAGAISNQELGALCFRFKRNLAHNPMSLSDHFWGSHVATASKLRTWDGIPKPLLESLLLGAHLDNCSLRLRCYESLPSPFLQRV